ncbi:Taxilin family, partial [Lipomyces oligophaga]|uniref:Taxilin family n=1 Tax=Lipomyces oligophaga TaxID=45792 RepID=UPI0034D005AB
EEYISRISSIQQRYSELFAVMKNYERECIQAKNASHKLASERDAAKKEASKAATMKTKLESVCRELQKENKKLKEENRVVQESEQREREALNSFRSEFNKLEEGLRDISAKQLKYDLNNGNFFKTKLKSLFEQYELRDSQLQKVIQVKDLEIRIYMNRYEKQKKIADTELERSNFLMDQVSTFTQTEADLRAQLNVYVEKFKQVEETLNGSNDLFLTFRKEMEQMTKKSKKLEKENKVLTKKAEVMNKNLLDMAEERSRQQQENEKTLNKLSKLENLCRALQAERLALEDKV